LPPLPPLDWTLRRWKAAKANGKCDPSARSAAIEFCRAARPGTAMSTEARVSAAAMEAERNMFGGTSKRGRRRRGRSAKKKKKKKKERKKDGAIKGQSRGCRSKGCSRKNCVDIRSYHKILAKILHDVRSHVVGCRGLPTQKLGVGQMKIPDIAL
jgi:hypothetical protein